MIYGGNYNASLSLDDLKTGADKPGDSKNSSVCKPEWYDNDKFARGQQFFRRHLATIGFSMHLSLMSGFSIINLLDPLVFTNKSNTPVSSVKRYLMTFYHIFLWMTEDVWDEKSKASKSLHTVRNMHTCTADAMKKSKNNNREYISQYDMALVQSGFYAAVILYPKQCGVHCTEEELEDYIFTWRVIGYLLGISDEYNTCRNYDVTFKICKEIEQKSLLPALESPPKQFKRIADAYINGLNSLIPINLPIHSTESSIALIYDCFGLDVPFSLSITDWCRFYFWKMYLYVGYNVPILNKYLNQNILNSFSRDMEKLFGKDIEEELKKYN